MAALEFAFPRAAGGNAIEIESRLMLATTDPDPSECVAPAVRFS